MDCDDNVKLIISEIVENEISLKKRVCIKINKTNSFFLISIIF